MFKWLKSKPPIQLANSNRFTEVVGESHYQLALTQVAGKKSEYSASKQVEANLKYNPKNKHSDTAVAVYVGYRKVGHLPHDNAVEFIKFARDNDWLDRTFLCNAKIVGGWKRDDSEGDYGIKLKVRWPLKAK